MGILAEFDTRWLVAVCLTGIVIKSLASWVWDWHRLKHVPGPFFASISYIWLTAFSLDKRQHERFQTIHREYGPLVRISPRELLTDDPELIRSMSATQGRTRRSRSYHGNRFNPYQDPLFSILDPLEHDRMKVKLAPAYSGRDAPDLERDIDDRVLAFTRLIREKYVSAPGKLVPLSLTRTPGLFTLDVISRLALGKEFGCLESDADPHAFYDTIEEHLPGMALTTNIPWLREIVYSPLCLRLFGPKETDKGGVGKLMKLTNGIVRERFGHQEKEQNDMLGSFIRHGLTQAECETESLLMFIAGSDTTAAVIRITMLHILGNPRIYQRLKQEITTAVNTGRISTPISNAQAKQLPYLQAVVYEGIRIRPVTTSMLMKEVAPGGETIHGLFVPGGTSIGVNLPSLLRREDLFGKDAHIFRPERFLEFGDDDPAAAARMKRDAELAFGYGRWMCAGKAVAFMELNKVFFEFLRHFDFEFCDPQNPMQTTSVVLYRDTGLDVRVTLSETGEADQMV